MVAPSVSLSGSVRKALGETKEELKALYGDRLQKLVVYGSQARGDARPDSDVDLMIILDGQVDPAKEADRTSEAVMRIAGRYSVVLSPLHMSKDEFLEDRPLPSAARREGVALNFQRNRCEKTSGKRKDDEHAKFWLEPIELERNDGFPGHELRDIESLIEEHQNHLLEAWHEHFS